MPPHPRPLYHQRRAKGTGPRCAIAQSRRPRTSGLPGNKDLRDVARHRVQTPKALRVHGFQQTCLSGRAADRIGPQTMRSRHSRRGGRIFRTIAVPTDGRAGSAEAVRLAARIARVHRATILSYYVVDEVLVARALASMREALRNELEAEGRKALREARGVCRRERASSREVLLKGNPVRRIIAAVREAGADLIVMRTSGRGPFASLVLGSPAQAVIRRAPCPVLLVRGGAASRPRRPAVRRTRRS